MPDPWAPRTRLDARRWRFLNEGDLFYPIWEWPHGMKILAMKPHLTNRERLNLIYFIMSNGGHPAIAIYAVHRDGYDDQAKRHIRYLIDNWHRYNYDYWDMRWRSYMNNERLNVANRAHYQRYGY